MLMSCSSRRRAARRAPALVALAALALPAAAAGQFAHPLYEDRHEVESRAEARIGKDFACAVVTPGDAGRRKLLVYVVSEPAADRARRLVRELDHPSSARVRLIGPRHRMRTMLNIRRKAEALMPGGGTSKAISLESPAETASCPRVELTIEPPGDASEADEAWAREAVEAWGSDRIAITRAKLGRGRGRAGRDAAARRPTPALPSGLLVPTRRSTACRRSSRTTRRLPSAR
jgi:hypothetical protein